MTAPFLLRRYSSTGPELSVTRAHWQLDPPGRFLSLPWARQGLLLAIAVALFFTAGAGDVGAQASDDHGNTFSAATNIALGSSLAGRIDYGEDQDVFKLDLTRAPGFTNVWIYTTGEFDSWGQLHDSNGGPIAVNDNLVAGAEDNFHLRAFLARAVYYIQVFSADDIATGDYTLHAEVASDPGNTIGVATNLSLDFPAPGMISTSSDSDYFRLDVTRTASLVISAKSGNYRPIDVVVYDEARTEIPVNVHALGTRLSSRIVWDGFRIYDDFEPGTYFVRVLAPPGLRNYPVPYTILSFDDVAYSMFIDECEDATRSMGDPLINDPLYACQWHLDNPDDYDINIEDVWAEGLTGDGINIAVVDNGMDHAHEDLAENVDTARNHDYTGSGDIHFRYAHHGTHLSGILAARDNDVGVRGVAPRATIYGYNLLRARTIRNVGDAMTRNGAETAVSNNSWGPVDSPGLGPAPAIWEAAIESGLRSGYDGKGTFYAWAGGNGHLVGDDSNLDEYANFYGVTAVCAVNDHDTRSSFSETGANLWVCAPSNDRGHQHLGIVTTENSNRYYNEFGGTSAATPLVAGVAALMRSANPNLSWRDLKLILAATARKNDANNPGWEVGALKHGSETDRYNFNREYGFGVVDAKAAVDLAKDWIGLPQLQSARAASGRLDMRIPDSPVSDAPERVPATVSTVTLNSEIGFTEFVEVNISVRHGSFRDLEIELVSPSGAVSKLVSEFDVSVEESFDRVRLNGSFRFGSARHLGGNPNGEWQLRVADRIPSHGGILDSWSITIYGHTGVLSCETGNAVADAVNNPGLVSDCKTLLGARYELAGPSGPNWSAQTPISEWDGVTVSGTPQRVTELDLYGSQLTGSIPAEMGDLQNLRALILSGNQLTGTIPRSLGNLPKLEALDIRSNELTGSIPTELGGISKLRSLSVGENDLTGPIPAWLGSLSDLLSLSLEGNGFTGPIPVELGGLVNLRTLSLADNSLTGPIPMELGGLSNLKELYLGGNQLTGVMPTWLDNLADLYVLSLTGNQLDGAIPQELGSLPNLTTLDLSDNRLSGPIPAAIGDLSNLRRIHLSGNQLEGCIPQQLRGVDETDFDDLGLQFCDVLLSDLTVNPGTLTAPFDPHETEYIAEGTSRVTVTPVNAHGATIRFLDENGVELADADRSLAGHQVDVDAADVKIRIVVTSQDRNSSLTYTLLIIRRDLPGPPVINAVTPGLESLVVDWTAPMQTGGADIASYDLRYIETAAPDFSDANWTLLQDVWSDGSLTYSIAGLKGGAEYTVQVRAVTAAGEGRWSNEKGGTAIASGDAPVFVDGLSTTRSIADNSAEGTDVGIPVAATVAGDHELTYTLGGTDAARFTIDEKTGQIKLGAGAALDYAVAPYMFSVDVTATGPSGTSSTIVVTIAVIDENLGTLGSRYDADRDRKIDRDEVVAAISDYFSDVISRDEVVRLIALYFSG